MAADLHIHVFAEGELTEEDFKDFFCSSMGSKWFDMERNMRQSSGGLDTYSKMSAVPNVWIGEVSWLKAALTEDPDTFVPDPIGTVADIVGEDLPVVDDEFIVKIGEALNLDNTTGYSVAGKDEVISFLEGHRGKRAFTVSW